MTEYLNHLKELQLNNELLTEFISPTAYNFLVTAGFIREDFYKQYIESACVYRQKWWDKNPLTIAEQIDRVKVHDRVAKAKQWESFAVTMAKKMVVYDFVTTMVEIKEKGLITN